MSIFATIQNLFNKAEPVVSEVEVAGVQAVAFAEQVLGIAQAAITSANPAAGAAVSPHIAEVESFINTGATDAETVIKALPMIINLLAEAAPFIVAVAA